MKNMEAMIPAILLVIGVLLVALAHPAQAFTRDYLLEVAYIDKSFNLDQTQVKEAAFRVLSEFVNWNRVVYSRIFVLNINGTPILYAKAFMVPYTPTTTTCFLVTVTTTPVTVIKECKTVTTTAPPNTGFTYYPTSKGMDAVYIKARLVLENNKIVDVEVLDYYKTVLGEDVWDPIAIGNIVAESVWESQAVVEAIVKAVVAEHLEPKETWLSTAELVYPPEYIISVIFFADDYVYGIIYDWDNHKILAVGLDIIEMPYYLPGQQHSFPTTAATIQPTTESKNTTYITTTITIITYSTTPTVTRPTTTSGRLPPATTTTTPIITTMATTYGSSETFITAVRAGVPTTATPSITTTTSGEEYSYELLSTRAVELKTLDTTMLAVVAISAIVVALLSWIIIRRVIV